MLRTKKARSLKELLEARDKKHGSVIALRIITIRDVAILKKVLDGFDAKTISIYTKDDYLKGNILSLVPISSTIHKIKLYLRYLWHRLERYHQVLHVYNAWCNIFAFIYKPWKVVITDPAGYDHIYVACLEKIYATLRVDIVGYEIEIII